MVLIKRDIPRCELRIGDIKIRQVRKINNLDSVENDKEKLWRRNSKTKYWTIPSQIKKELVRQYRNLSWLRQLFVTIPSSSRPGLFLLVCLLTDVLFILDLKKFSKLVDTSVDLNESRHKKVIYRTDKKKPVYNEKDNKFVQLKLQTSTLPFHCLVAL